MVNHHSPLMRGADAVRYLVIHCSATRADRDYPPEQMLRDHRARGFRTIGYHFYIRKNGEVTRHRLLLEMGAHAKGYNRCSIGICYEGGLIEVKSEERKVKNSSHNSSLITHHYRLQPADTRTPAQCEQLLLLLMKLKKMFPKAKIVGHRDLPGVHKDCPCFDATSEYASL